MRILVFQHLDVQNTGAFGEIWQAKDYGLTTIELDAGDAIPDLDGFDLLVVMGGPMDVWDIAHHPWLIAEKSAIRRWVGELKRPYLGVCLGHQLLADVLGGEVTLMERPEVGVVPVSLTPSGLIDQVLVGVPENMEVLTWHSAEVSKLPENAVVLAQNDACSVQAMRWGRHAYSFQYNIEITADLLRDWSAIPEYKSSLEDALGVGGAEKLRASVQARLPLFRARTERIESNLLTLVRGA
ncbi:type 1 glutamine amidotransferase [Paraburkholderia sediminicola]|uniref:type 1 glutamine amidotransferase n=1 Tax=Paraburkholderia sediminicola TaxID=458836 RepID=UPI0038B72D28